MGEQDKRELNGDFKELLNGDLFTSAMNTRIVFKNQERKRKELTPEKRTARDQLNYSQDIIHLFPEHPKAPYMQEDTKYSQYPVNIAYTIDFILDVKADKKGEPRCSPEALTERTYIALMARTNIDYADAPRKKEGTLNMLEDAITPDIAERYGWEQEYVRKGILDKCVAAMIDAFTQKPELLNIFKGAMKRNGQN